ncbi:preprotein translocase subunit SECE1 [Camellia sinensis]|uniref:Preprotein translocase subunit SECE1 n=1 Tax=Camellia sinensis var. sinensis TaxID=542762 RepID=A0A4S4EP21_CAMSN|nr:preprotein translocase subunit SECE1 [Camellia sinensis]THG18468.1 hypothetical protein TEA_004696 [Camellia sinensis var. sinensis]
MALQLSLQFPILPKTSSYPQIKLTHKPMTITRTTKRNITQFTIKATTSDEENNNNNVSEPQIVSTQQSTPNEQQPQPTNSSTSDLSDLGSEIKKAMKERDGDGGGDLWSGVAEEIREIEWPAFGKVVGTTGVVLGVIAGSSVVLLTVNAVLAELSDRVFAGKGLQDFFG